MRRRAVHPDLAVTVECHEPPRGVDERLTTVRSRRAARRWPPSSRRRHHPAGRPRFADRTPGSRRGRGRPAGRRRTREVVVPPGSARARASGTGRSPTGPREQQFVGAVRDRRRGVAVGRAAVRRVVLEAAVRAADCGEGVTTIPSARAAGRRRCAEERRGSPPASGCKPSRESITHRNARPRPAPRGRSPTPAPRARACRGEENRGR